MSDMKFKFITVTESDETDEGKLVYEITNNRKGDVLGNILWYAPWRQWVAEFEFGSVWSAGCLADVQAAMRQIAEAKR